MCGGCVGMGIIWMDGNFGGDLMCESGLVGHRPRTGKSFNNNLLYDTFFDLCRI